VVESIGIYFITTINNQIISMKLKNFAFQIIMILFFSASSGLLYNLLSDHGIPLIRKSIDLKPGSHLTLEQTYTLLVEKNALFIDTRYMDEYLTGHISGAQNLPANASRDQISNFLQDISKSHIIVTYCSSPRCLSSRRLAGFLTYQGYTNVFIYLAGFEEWEKEKYPVERTTGQ
jgi:rhodanese-related sulfurtransferase